MAARTLHAVLKRRNPAYIGARLVRRMAPEALAQRWLSRRHIPTRDLYEKTTRKYLAGIVQGGLDGRFFPGAALTLVETGTGFYNPASAPLMCSGVERLILIEPYAGARPDVARFCNRFEDLCAFAAADPGYPLPIARRAPADTRAHGLPAGVELSMRFWEDTALPDGAVDGIFSASVLEHLRDPEAVLRECARVLKPGGFMINAVDLRDHFFRYPLEMLKFSEAAWQRLTTPAGGSGYQNRWRLGRWLEALTRHGFVTRVFPTLEAQELAEREQPFLHPDFHGLPLEELRVLMAILVSYHTERDA